MVSLQTGLFPWFDYEFDFPGTDQYLPPYLPDHSSYTLHTLRLAPKKYIDRMVLDALPLFFARLYESHTQMFSSTDRYSLFVPLRVDRLRQAYDILCEPGFGASLKLARIEAASEIERILRQHMVKYRIEPSLLYHHDSTVESVENIFYVDRNGNVNLDSTNRIEMVKTFDHATLFFITHEI